MMSFVKLDCGILDSSLWRESIETKVVFITMLAMADMTGLVRSTAPGISQRSGVGIEATRTALSCLESPDPDSRSQNDEGRRIKRVDGGYEIVNYSKYREYDHTNAERQARFKAKLKCGNAVTSVTSNEVTPLLSASASKSFEDFWILYPRKVGKGAAMKSWERIKPDADKAEAIYKAVMEQRKWEAWADPKFIPHPATWLNRQGWEDEPTGPAVPQKHPAARVSEFWTAPEGEA